MKYYIYISDTKVDMLAAQVPVGFRERLAAELKIDLKIFSISLSQSPTDETRYSKIALVERYLAEEGQIGTVEAPLAYFSGTIPMVWSPYSSDGYGERPDIAMIWFAAEAPGVRLGLAGSTRHLIGGVSFPEQTDEQGQPTHAGFSGMESVARTLLADTQPDFVPLVPVHPENLMVGVDRLSAIWLDGARRRGVPAVPVVFLARRLLAERRGTRLLVLGSPLYVAYVE